MKCAAALFPRNVYTRQVFSFVGLRRVYDRRGEKKRRRKFGISPSPSRLAAYRTARGRVGGGGEVAVVRAYNASFFFRDDENSCRPSRRFSLSSSLFQVVQNSLFSPFFSPLFPFPASPLPSFLPSFLSHFPSRCSIFRAPPPEAVPRFATKRKHAGSIRATTSRATLKIIFHTLLYCSILFINFFVLLSGRSLRRFRRFGCYRGNIDGGRGVGGRRGQWRSPNGENGLNKRIIFNV